MGKRLAIGVGVVVAALALLVIGRLSIRPITDERRYDELRHFGTIYKRAWAGKPRLADRVAAWLHFTALTNYYRGRMETDSKALLASGYFVETSVPVSDLRTNLSKVRATLSQVFQKTGAYYDAKLNWPSNEVLLTCRKQDVPLWRGALGKTSNSKLQTPEKPQAAKRNFNW